MNFEHFEILIFYIFVSNSLKIKISENPNKRTLFNALAFKVDHESIHSIFNTKLKLLNLNVAVM